jgi:UDP-N-acetylglucosamine acyltransferase
MRDRAARQSTAGQSGRLKLMNSIHPTAVIGRNVRLGTGNVVGPFAVIGGDVTIGDGNWFGSGAKIGCPPEVRGFPHDGDWIDGSAGSGVSIGDGNVFREEVQVHGGWRNRTTVGHGVFIMNRAYIAHDGEISDAVTIASGVAIGGHVRLGRGANLGLNASVHQRRVVGAFAMVGMGSVVTTDVPPFVKAFGNPCRIRGVNAVGLERAGMSPMDVERVVAEFASTGSTTADGLRDGFDLDLNWYQTAGAHA